MEIVFDSTYVYIYIYIFACCVYLSEYMSLYISINC